MNHKFQVLWSAIAITGVVGTAYYILSTQSHKRELTEERVSAIKLPDSSCHNRITREESHLLLAEIGKINEAFFDGTQDVEARNQGIVELITQLNPNDDRKKEGVIKAYIAQQNELFSTQFVQALALRYLSGQALTEKDLEILNGINIDDPETYIELIASRFRPYFTSLIEHGASFDSETGWIFSVESLQISDLKEDPPFYISLMMLFSPRFAEELSNSERRRTIVAGQQAFLPPSQKSGIEGTIYIYDVERYKSMVQKSLSDFNRAMKGFLAGSEGATTYSNLAQGSFAEYLGGERGHEGRTAEEIQRDGYYDQLVKAQRRLIQWLGVSEEIETALNKAVHAAIHIDKSNIEAGLTKIDIAMKGTLAAPLIPVIIAVAPLAGGLVGGTKMATLVGAGAASMALMPLVFGIGVAALDASVEYTTQGGSWFCYFAEQLVEKGTGALYVAPFLAAIPVGAALAAAAPMTIGAYIGQVGVAVVGAQAAPMIYGGINLATALYFLQHMGRSGIQGIAQCKALLERAVALSKSDETSEEHVEALLVHAEKLCLEGGVDLAFAITGSTHMARGGLQAWRSSLSSHSRLKQAEIVLKRDITSPQKKAVLKAHEVGQGAVGKDGVNPAGINNYTARQITRKTRILKEAGFNKSEIRVLMERGVVGSFSSLTPMEIFEKFIQKDTRAEAELAIIENLNGTVRAGRRTQGAYSEQLEHSIWLLFFRKILGKPHATELPEFLEPQRHKIITDITLGIKKVIVPGPSARFFLVYGAVKRDGFASFRVREFNFFELLQWEHEFSGKDSVERMLGTSLSRQQRIGLVRAREIGIGELGADGLGDACNENYTVAQEKLKLQILTQHGFTPSNAVFLMERGLLDIEARPSSKDLLIGKLGRIIYQMALDRVSQDRESDREHELDSISNDFNDVYFLPTIRKKFGSKYEKMLKQAQDLNIHPGVIFDAALRIADHEVAYTMNKRFSDTRLSLSLPSPSAHMINKAVAYLAKMETPALSSKADQVSVLLGRPLQFNEAEVLELAESVLADKNFIGKTPFSPMEFVKRLLENTGFTSEEVQILFKSFFH